MGAILAITAASISVAIGDYQWDYVDGKVYGVINEVETDSGQTYRELTGTTQRKRKVRFTKLDTIMESLRRLSMVAGRKALPVVFTPDDTDLGTTWVVDWPEQVEFQRDLDNRQTFEVEITEQP